MTKGFSLGDFTINQQATDQSAPKGFNLQDYNQNKLPPNTEQIKEDPNINNFISIYFFQIDIDSSISLNHSIKLII